MRVFVDAVRNSGVKSRLLVKQKLGMLPLQKI